MSNVLVHFYPSDSHLASNSYDHMTEELMIEKLPEKGDTWRFEIWRFNSMEQSKQKRFEQLFKADTSEFVVLDLRDYRNDPGKIDYSMYVAQQLIDGKSAFIDENDKNVNE